MTKECRSPNDKISPRPPRAVTDAAMRCLSFLLLAFAPALHAADNVSVLGTHPRWRVLENYQETITHDEFAHLINDVYCTHGFAPDLVEINEKTSQILMNRET